jgi:hypothetical protein
MFVTFWCMCKTDWFCKYVFFFFWCFEFSLCEFSNFLFHLSYRMSLMLYNFLFIYVSTHSHIPYHCEAQSKWALYIPSLGICFFLCKNFSSWFKQSKLPVQYTLTQDAPYASPGRDPIGSYSVTDVCIRDPENINNRECITEKARYCMELLLQQYWLVFVNMSNSEF